jgi:hypothetical protein
MTKISVDEQIANAERVSESCRNIGIVPYDTDAILASLRRLKRTEAEALRDHARTWVWGFVCGLVTGLAAFYITMALLTR